MPASEWLAKDQTSGYRSVIGARYSLLMKSSRAASGDRRHWDSTVQLLQSLVRCFPHYGNPEGQRHAIDLIHESLREGHGYTVHRLRYRNRDVEAHPDYIPIDSFGKSFRDDPVRSKTGIVAVSDSLAVGHGDCRTIVLNAHYDVDGVYDKTAWSEDGLWRLGEKRANRIYGRGATDMLAGLCALLTAFKTACESTPAGVRLVLSIVPDEEVGGNGSLYQLEWMRRHLHLDPSDTSVLIAEPSDGNVCTESLGFLPFSVRWREPTCHAGAHEMSGSVVEELSELVRSATELTAHAANRSRLEPDTQPCRITIGRIVGGIDPTIPLGSLEASGVVFPDIGVDLERFRVELERSLRDKIRSSAIVSFPDPVFAGHRSAPCLVAEALRRETSEHTSTLFTSPCDARLFARAGYSVVIHGPGSLAQAHATNEHIDLEDLHRYLGRVGIALSGRGR